MHTQTFIRLEDGRELTRARPGKTIEIHNVEQVRKVYDKQGFPVFDDQQRPTYEIFRGTVNYQERDLFKPDIQRKLNIVEGVRLGFEKKYYNKTGETEEVIDGKLTIVPALTPRMTPVEYAKKLKAEVTQMIRQQYLDHKKYYNEVSDSNSPLYDSGDPYILEFEAWRVTLKTTFELFKSEVSGILQGSGSAQEKYEALIEWTYQDRLPKAPVPGVSAPQI